MGKGLPLEPRYNRRTLIYGFGVNDYIGSTCVNGKHIKSYSLWRGMIKRIYSDSKNAYRNCTISEEWKYFSNFKKDVESLVGYNNDWHFDKDILSNGNKSYSKEHCVFVPQEVNKLFTGNVSNIFTGVSKMKNGRYRVRCSYNSKSIFIGYFDDVYDARIAYIVNKEKIIKDTIERYKNLVDERVYNKLTTINLLDYYLAFNDGGTVHTQEEIDRVRKMRNQLD